MQKMIFHCTDTTALLPEWIMIELDDIKKLPYKLQVRTTSVVKESNLWDLPFSLLIMQLFYYL